MANTRHIYSLFDSIEAASAARDALLECGCTAASCSVVLHEDHLRPGALTSQERAGIEGAGKGAIAGGSVGAILGGLAAVGGGVVALGPLAAAAALGGGVMAAYGALTGAIAGGDEPESDLRKIESELEAGKVLLAFETDDEDLAEKGRAVLQGRGGVKIAP